MNWFTHAQIFDDLLAVAQKETVCYVWKTEAGLVIFHGLWPDERAYQAILTAVEEAGWSDSRIVRFVMPHGRTEAVGCGKWLAEQGARTCISEKDDQLRRQTDQPEAAAEDWNQFDISYHLQDGDEIACGDKSFTVLSTPGYTEGCMSFFFPVHEDGNEYMAGLFGGGAVRQGDEKTSIIQKASVIRFKQHARLNNCQVGLTCYTAFDNGLERIAYSRKRMRNLPNIYVLGTEGVQKFFSVFRTAHVVSETEE